MDRRRWLGRPCPWQWELVAGLVHITVARQQRAEVGARQLPVVGPPTEIHLGQQDHGQKSVTSPSSATTWVPSVQTHLPVGDRLSPNCSSGPALPLL